MYINNISHVAKRPMNRSINSLSLLYDYNKIVFYYTIPHCIITNIQFRNHSPVCKSYNFWFVMYKYKRTLTECHFDRMNYCYYNISHKNAKIPMPNEYGNKRREENLEHVVYDHVCESNALSEIQDGNIIKSRPPEEIPTFLSDVFDRIYSRSCPFSPLHYRNSKSS